MIGPEHIAFQGSLEIVDAAWSLASGRTVTFRICGEAFGRTHPFKIFQQRRAGRVGSRFAASFAMENSGELLPNMEVMLCSWKDSSSIGQTVQFWLDNEAHTHPFSGCAYRKGSEPGSIFAGAFVEIGDDDQPVRQQPGRDDPIPQAGIGRAPVGDRALPVPAAAVPPGQAGGADADAPDVRGAKNGASRPGANNRVPGKPRRLSSLAHLTSTNSMFIRFLQETKPNMVKEWTPDVARRYVKATVRVESMADLDRDAAAAGRYEEMIRKPYSRWRYQHPE